MGVLATIVFLGLIAVVVVKFGTSWAIPGWASYVGASLIMIIFQTMILAGSCFVLLSELQKFQSICSHNRRK